MSSAADAVGGVVGTVAPAVGTAIGGPVGGLIAGQVSSSLFGGREAERAAGTRATGIAEGARISAEGIETAQRQFQPFTVGAAEAAQEEAALSGALGPEAEAEAIARISDSPFTRFIQERGREQINQGFAASGGLGGGERLKALTEFGQGVASQSIAQRLQDLRNVRASGTTAATNIADLIARGSGVEGAGVAGAAGARATGREARAGQLQEGIEGLTTTIVNRDRIRDIVGRR